MTRFFYRARFRFVWAVLFGLVLSLQVTISAQQTDFIIEGLDGEITIHFDEFGIPNIYATTTRDLFTAQGFVHASARWWQMEWLRHSGAGRLSELVGQGAVEQDAFIRTIGLPRNAEHNLAGLPTEASLLLESYSKGVNSWIEGREAEELALEYQLLKDRGNEVTVEAWRGYDSMLLQSLQALGFTSTTMFTEVFKGEAQAQIGDYASSLILPSYPYSQHPNIMQPDWSPSEGATDGASNAFPGLNIVYHALELTGSNSWTVSGERSVTGKPLLANDTHMSVHMPSFWYENGLHCVEITSDCPYDVYGMSIPGTPGIIIGHNQTIGWGVTNAELDATDFYHLDINPDNPLQYLYNGQYVDMQVIDEVITPFDGEAVAITIRLTAFGPVLEKFEDLELTQPVALRWANADGNRTFQAVLHLNHAQNWDEFQDALALFDIPGLNFHYADVEGNIGYLLGGRIPKRAAGHDGSKPMPGTDDTYQWLGYVDPGDNPRLYNPPTGYIYSANNAIVDPDQYPDTIATFFDYGYRAARIAELLQQTDKHSVDTFKAIQLDSYNPAAELILPVLQTLEFESEETKSAVDWLTEWDYQNQTDSPQAALFNVFWSKLMLTGLEELPLYESSHSIYLMSQIINAPLHVLWINADKGLIGRDTVLQKAFQDAYTEMVTMFGADREKWRYGDLHKVHFEPAILDYISVDADLYQRFTPSIGIDGGFSSINVGSYDPRKSLNANNIPTMRMILDFSNFDQSLYINSTGEIGDVRDPRYGDMVELWATGQYHAHAFNLDKVKEMSTTVWHIHQ